MNNKLLFMLLVIVLSAAVLTGCGHNLTKQPETSSGIQLEKEEVDSMEVEQKEKLSFRDTYGMELPGYITTGGRERELCPSGNGGFQVCIQKTTIEEYKQYVELLENSGFEIYCEKEIQGNLFHTCITDDLQVFLSWNPSLNTSRIVFQEPDILPALEKPILTEEDNVVMSVSQLALTDEGMSYVIQTAEGSFIVIDGGKSNFTDRQTLYDFLVEKTPKGDVPLIETWMFTHPDNDHIELAKDFISAYADQVEINSFAYNFADSTVYSTDSQEIMIAELKQNIARSYPNAVTYTFHAGQTYYYKGVTIEILLTEEDLYPLKAESYNDTSAAWRVVFDNGETFLVLGDCMSKLCKQLAGTYGDYLKSDILQMAHHGLVGGDKKLYQYIDPAVCFWAVSEARFNGNYEEKYHYCLGEGPCVYNAWIRDETVRVREHYPHSATTTLLMGQ